jgi:hypothetical protein
MNYHDAITSAKEGNLIYREGWNGKGIYVFLQVPSEVPEAIIPKMSSLPSRVKTLLIERGKPLRYHNQAALISPDNSIQGWSPSLSDTLAEDWCALWLPEEEYTAAPVAETAGTATPLT